MSPGSTDPSAGYWHIDLARSLLCKDRPGGSSYRKPGNPICQSLPMSRIGPSRIMPATFFVYRRYAIMTSPIRALVLSSSLGNYNHISLIAMLRAACRGQIVTRSAFNRVGRSHHHLCLWTADRRMRKNHGTAPSHHIRCVGGRYALNWFITSMSGISL